MNMYSENLNTELVWYASGPNLSYIQTPFEIRKGFQIVKLVYYK
jgi:hypothetical protein